MVCIPDHRTRWRRRERRHSGANGKSHTVPKSRDGGSKNNCEVLLSKIRTTVRQSKYLRFTI